MVDTTAHNLFEAVGLGDLNRLIHSATQPKWLFQGSGGRGCSGDRYKYAINDK